MITLEDSLGTTTLGEDILGTFDGLHSGVDSRSAAVVLEDWTVYMWNVHHNELVKGIQ